MSRLDGLGHESQLPSTGLVVKLTRTIEKLEREKEKSDKELKRLSAELDECKKVVIAANQVYYRLLIFINFA